MKNFLTVFILLFSCMVYGQQKEMSLEDAVLGRYSYLKPEELKGLSWMDDQVFTFLKNDTLWSEEARSGNKTHLISADALNSILKHKDHEKLNEFPEYLWVGEKNLLLQISNNYFVVDLEKGETEIQIELPENAENSVYNHKGKYVAFTKGNDLFIAFPDSGIIQITNDGGNGIVNGKTVHRVEFGISKGIFDSPGGNLIAFYRKDESMVTDYPLVDFTGRIASHKPVKYPMAGKNSHHVTVGVYDIASDKTIFLKTGDPPDHFLTNIAWSPDEKYIYIFELNREQNHLCLNCYDATSGNKVKMLFEEKDDKYVEPLNPIWFSKADNNIFYYLNRNNGWFHVYKYFTTGKLIKQITKGEWEVTRILGFDSKERYMFIEATKDSPLEKNLYSVEIRSGEIKKISEGEGIHQGMLSRDGSYLIDNFTSTHTPHKTVLISADGRFSRKVHAAKDPLIEYKIGDNKLVTITSGDGKTDLTGRLILPVDFDPSKKYPVIVYVYGGPHSQMVTKNWHNNATWWQYYMASQGFIGFTMDNRGTNNRGRDFETVIHRRLGILETEDQMKGIEYLRSLPYVDHDRIGVHGWSYGGFMTLNMLLRHPETFKVGAAGGPVVDWSMYEVMYGERYMDTPGENPRGYAETNMINHIQALKGKLMLIHGMQDDIVVLQHSMKFIRECVKQGKQIDFFAYPTHPHNIRGEDRLHLMEKISSYFTDNL